MTSTWTDDRVDLLKALNSDGFTGRGIALRLGVSRNAVIGKLLRLGIPMAGAQGARLKRRPPKEAYHFFAGPARPPKKLKPKFAPRIVHMLPPAEPITGGVSFEDLKSHQCKWPLGEFHDAPERFCGEPRSKDRPYCSYCSYHAAIAYRKAPRRQEPGPLYWILKRAA